MARYRPKNREVLDATVLTFDGVKGPSATGKAIEVGKGDFLVTREDGSQFVAKKEDFLEEYEEMRPQGRQPGTKMRKDVAQVEQEETLPGTDGFEDEEEEDGQEPVTDFRPHPKPNARRNSPIPQPLRS